ncbi:MAG: mechanosensitive ion channel family protein [Thermonemataceae bacterium]
MKYIKQVYEAFEQFLSTIVTNIPNIIVGVVILGIFVFLGAQLKRLFTRVVATKAKDELFVRFLGNFLRWVIIAIGIVILLNQMGLSKAASGMLAGAGVSAIVIGFAFKEIGENLLSGIYLALSRPFEIGDLIEVEGMEGIVKAIQLRSVYIRTFGGEDIHIPNSIIIKNPVTNLTRDGLRRWEFIVGLDYDDDIELALSKINEGLSQVEGIEQSDTLKPFTLIDDFGTSNINLKVLFWIDQDTLQHPLLEVINHAKLTVLRIVKDNDFYIPTDIVELKLYQNTQPFEVKLEGSEQPASD